MKSDLSLVLFQGILLVCVKGIFSVTVDTPRQLVSAPVGDEVEFICNSNVDRQSCIITPPGASAIPMIAGAIYEDGRLDSIIDDPKQCGVRITRLEEKDHGVWKCQVSVVDNGKYEEGSGSMDVVVSVPPSNVLLRQDGVPITNERIQIDMVKPDESGANAENSRNFSCVAEQTRPAPEFRWYIGNTEITGNVQDTTENENDNGVKDFVQTLLYFPDSKHNGQILKCEVEHSAFTERQLANSENVVEKILEILFAPKEQNKVINVYGLKEGNEDVATIKFEANPKPNQGSWTVAGQEAPIVFGTESIDKKFKSSFIDETELDGEYSVTLTIREVTAEMIGKTNKVTVTNDHGTTTYDFVLHLGEKAPAEGEIRSSTSTGDKIDNGDNLGSGPVIGVIVVVALVVLLIGIAIVARSKGILCFAGKPKEKEEDTEQTVEKEGDTESAEDHNPENKDDLESGNQQTEEQQQTRQQQQQQQNKKSIGSKFSNIFAVFKKSVAKKNKEGLNESEVKLHEGEKKDTDEVTYADLDQTALEKGSRTTEVTQGEDEPTEYAEIKPQQ